MTDINLRGVSERDLDLFLLEEVVASDAFRSWFLTRIDLDPSAALIHAGRSVMTSTGESDLEFTYEDGEGSTVRVLVKNKVDAVFQDLRQLSLLASRALTKGWIAKRPKVKQYDVPARIRWLESDEIPAYMAALRAPFRPQFQLLLGTGMRLGESEMTRVCDVRFGGDGCRIMLRDSKTTTGVRPVFVPWWTADSLREHIERHHRSGTDRVFQIQRRTVQAEHNRACGIVGIPDYTVHDHRHTFAVHAARNGMPLDRLQQQLGHVNIEMTMKYARFHPAYNDVGRFFNAMGERWGIGPNPKVQGTNQGTPVKSGATANAP